MVAAANFERVLRRRLQRELLHHRRLLSGRGRSNTTKGRRRRVVQAQRAWHSDRQCIDRQRRNHSRWHSCPDASLTVSEPNVGCAFEPGGGLTGTGTETRRCIPGPATIAASESSTLCLAMDLNKLDQCVGQTQVCRSVRWLLQCSARGMQPRWLHTTTQFSSSGRCDQSTFVLKIIGDEAVGRRAQTRDRSN